MSLLSLDEITLRYGGVALLDQARLEIQPRERIALVGRNGQGKSTLLQIAAGRISPDEGEVRRARDLGPIGFLPQDIPDFPSASVREVVGRQSDADSPRVERTISRLQLNPDADTSKLSVGLKRRVLLASCLAQEPRLLLLDEPTNHLDLPAIEWLEKEISGFNGAVMFVTHDRAFLERIATRIAQIDRGQLTRWDCDYPTFIERYDAKLQAESAAQARFDRRLAEEEVWIRRGIPARRTRNEGRVRALQAMRQERVERRERAGRVTGAIQEASRSGRIVLRTRGLRVERGGNLLLDGLNLTVERGDRVAILGPNGCGKTSLIRTLLGQDPPDGGELELGTNLEVAYFDQNHAQLDLDATVAESLPTAHDSVWVDDHPVHITRYLQNFLFTPDDSRKRVRSLSGGERNRLMLARVFALPSNLLVMDEPTNDLDLETLELLEERLGEYGGTLLVVSHDRTFVNRVATSTLVFEDKVREYVGGYDEWVRQRPASTSTPTKSDQPRSRATPSQDSKPRKLTFREIRELDELPAKIERLETEQTDLHETMAEPSFYQQNRNLIARATARIKELETLLESCYERWAELEELR